MTVFRFYQKPRTRFGFAGAERQMDADERLPGICDDFPVRLRGAPVAAVR
jgi:hypothetical protein